MSVRPEGAEENVADGVENPVRLGREASEPHSHAKRGNEIKDAEATCLHSGIAAFRLLWLSAWGFIPWR
ncbi:MAG: hypothetical protein B6245_22355 [Desulfobacteraceae bacterium 4572_88]|nr:MAG: hypothetical protein B6245_22355 [Desulfobacteraceae bacterium 4572_88]